MVNKKVLDVLKACVVPALAEQNEQSSASLDELCAVVPASVHDPLNVERAQAIIAKIQVREHRRLALGVLASAENIDCKILAVQLDPTLKRSCADDLMSIARRCLMESTSYEKALAARRALRHAREWYEGSRVPSAAYLTEILMGLEATRWVEQ